MRTVIRSMVMPSGSVVAMDDGTITWRPRHEKQRSCRIESQASVMLGLMGPMGQIDRIVIGDVNGGVNIISLARMELADRFVISESPIRSLCSCSMSGESILAGCEDGGVYMLGPDVPGRTVGLFQLDGPASAIRVVGQSLHIQQGWERKIVDWTGESTTFETPSFKPSLALA